MQGISMSTRAASARRTGEFIVQKNMLTFAVGALVMSVISGTASAATNLVSYPGITCRGTTSKPFVSSMTNSTTADDSLWCPVPSTLNTTLGGVVVYVEDRSTTADVSCILVEVNAFPQLTIGWMASAASTGSSGSQTVVMNGKPHSTSLTYTNYLYCTLP